MSNDKITGVFVRLPLSEERVSNFRLAEAHADDSDMEEIITGLRVIGTPVTGGDIPVVAYTSQYDIDRVRKGKSGDIYGSRQWEGSDDPVFDIPLVRQSDHQAAIAALEAEVGRLRESLEEIELGIDALSIEDDDGRRMAASEMKRQALEVVRSEMKALKGPEA